MYIRPTSERVEGTAYKDPLASGRDNKIVKACCILQNILIPKDDIILSSKENCSRSENGGSEILPNISAHEIREKI